MVSFRLASTPGGLPLDPYVLLPPVFTDLRVEDDEEEGGPTLAHGGAALYAYARLQFEDVTPEERKEENEAEMTSSQDLATAAALTELGIPFDQTLSVAGVGEDGPSAGILREGDVFVSLNGYAYQIPRGVPCSVPVEVIEILQNAKQTTYTQTPTGVVERTVQRFPFSVQ